MTDYLPENDDNPCFPLEQELNEKVAELESQRLSRIEMLTDIKLYAIAGRVASQDAEMKAQAIAAGKPLSAMALQKIVTEEVVRAADGDLWCDHYSERAKSDQLMDVYVGSHWERIDSQQWMDFVDLCATRCGLADSYRMSPAFMNRLYEGIAFNLKKHRRQTQPSDEVWLNMSNGTLVIHSDGRLELRDHRRDDLFFYCLEYCYDPQADCPLWQHFLDRVQPAADAQTLLGEYLGYCLMRDHRFEKLMWFYGNGQNGKSTALAVIERLFGVQNVCYLSLEHLTNDEKKRAMFEHKLLNISSETGRDINPSIMKQIASGESLTVELKYQNPRQITDYGKVITATNQMAKAENTFAFFRRFIILPFEQTISESEKDVHLAEKLTAELPGILNWIVGRLVGLMQRQAFTTCESSERALEDYKLQSDNVKMFLKEMLTPSETPTKGSDIYGAYLGYCKSSGLYPAGKQNFYKRLDTLTNSRVEQNKLTCFKLKLAES